MNRHDPRMLEIELFLGPGGKFHCRECGWSFFAPSQAEGLAQHILRPGSGIRSVRNDQAVTNRQLGLHFFHLRGRTVVNRDSTIVFVEVLFERTQDCRIVDRVPDMHDRGFAALPNGFRRGGGADPHPFLKLFLQVFKVSAEQFDVTAVLERFQKLSVLIGLRIIEVQVASKPGERASRRLRLDCRLQL